jgi:hypothetical protein
MLKKQIIRVVWVGGYHSGDYYDYDFLQFNAM